MNSLRVSLLGACKFESDGKPLTADLSKKGQALLSYLLLTRGIHSREFLSSLLWSDQEESQAKKNLRNILPELRTHFSDYIIITRQTVEFVTQKPYEVDAELFERIVGGNLKQIALPTLENALNLYQGEFLEGFHMRGARLFESWLRSQREFFHNMAVTGREAFARLLIDQNDFERGGRAASQLIELEPFNEAGYQLAMQALAAQGQLQDVVAQYERCKEVLLSEIGVDVSAETEAIYQQSIAAPSTHTTPTAPPQPETQHPHNIIMRDAELTLFQESLSKAAEGQGQVLFVTGDRGSGKSALLHQFLQYSSVRNIQTLNTSVSPLATRSDVYGIFRDLLKTIRNWSTSNQSVTEKVLKKIHSMANRQLLVIAVDNLHRADSASWMLLFELIKQITNKRVLIVASYPTEWNSDQQKNIMLNKLSTQDNFALIDLDAARQRIGQQFTDSLLDLQPNHLPLSFRRQLFAMTKGHPQLTVELLHHLETKHIIKPDKDNIVQLKRFFGWDTIPASTETLIKAWLLPLPQELLKILEVASIEGEEFTATIICDALEISFQYLGDQLGYLNRKYGLIDEHSPVRIGRKQYPRYRFRYPIVRHYIYNTLTPLEHSSLTETLGLALDRLYTSDQ